MRAAFLVSHGEKESLVLGERPVPTRGAEDALVRLRVAAMNRVDLYMRDDARGITHELPLIAGVDGAGDLVEGGESAGLKPGDRVMVFPPVGCGICEFCRTGDQTMCRHLRVTGEHRDGCYAEFISLPARSLLPIPAALGYEHAACFGGAYTTAWRGLFTRGRLKAGETVLITGIGGGVAVAALQFAVAAGARVIVTSSRDRKIECAIALGAIAGVNYRNESVVDRVLSLTGGRGVDLVFDGAGAPTWDASLRLLVRGGRLVSYGATGGADPSADVKRLFIKQLEMIGTVLCTRGEADRMLAFCQARPILPAIDRRFPLADIHAAYNHLARGDQFGKVVIEIG
jgi:NADPH:quinone reductase-like Zn-dependent oxidoreductase